MNLALDTALKRQRQRLALKKEAKAPQPTPKAPSIPKVPLHESDAAKQFNTIWLSAQEFFEQRADELVSLPPDSNERMAVEAALGVLEQYKVDADEDPSPDEIRNKAQMLADKINELFDRRDSNDDLKVFAEKLASGMREFHNQVEPGNEPEEEPGNEEEGDERFGKPEGEEEDDHPDFERDMGAELKQPAKPTSGTRMPESVQKFATLIS